MKRIISVSGLDGSGKSSLIKRLQADIPDAKVLHIIHFRIVNRLKRSQSSTKSSVSQQGRSVGASFINLLLMIFDALVFNVYVFFSKKTIICDRYFYDLIATNAYRNGPSWLSTVVLLLVKKPNLSFFIDVEPELALARELDGEHDITYFNVMKDIYNRQFISSGTFQVVENKDLDSAYKQIKKAVETL